MRAERCPCRRSNSRCRPLGPDARQEFALAHEIARGARPAPQVRPARGRRYEQGRRRAETTDVQERARRARSEGPYSAGWGVWHAPSPDRGVPLTPTNDNIHLFLCHKGRLLCRSRSGVHESRGAGERVKRSASSRPSSWPDSRVPTSPMSPASSPPKSRI